MSYAFDGAITLMPGKCAGTDSRLWLCCPAYPFPPPIVARITSGNRVLAPEHVARLCRLVPDLVHGLQHEVDVHELDHRPQPRHCRPDSRAADRRLRDRRVEYAFSTEDLQQAGGGHVGAPLLGDILSPHAHPFVPDHLLGQRLHHRVARHDLPFGVPRDAARLLEEIHRLVLVPDAPRSCCWPTARQACPWDPDPSP